MKRTLSIVGIDFIKFSALMVLVMIAEALWGYWGFLFLAALLIVIVFFLNLKYRESPNPWLLWNWFFIQRQRLYKTIELDMAASARKPRRNTLPDRPLIRR